MATAYRDVLGGVLDMNPRKDRASTARKVNTTIQRDVEFALEFERDHKAQTVAYFAELKNMKRPAMSCALKRGRAELAKRGIDHRRA